MTAQVPPDVLERPATVRVERRAARFFGLVKNSTLAASDQALFSGANFLLSVLLARWMTPADYGAYSLAYAIFLLFSSMHGALMTEPMMVFGASRYASSFSAYTRMLVRGNFALTIPLGLVLAAAAPALGRLYSPQVGWALAGLAVSSPAILLFWLLRRAPYVVLRPQQSVLAGLCYLPALLGSAAILKYAGHMAAFPAYVAMGVASGLACLFLLSRSQRGGEPNGVAPSAREVAHDHWGYGRWAVGTAAVQWFPGQVYYALLPAWLGLEGVAGLRALMNFALPVAQAISALTMLLLPMLVRDRAEGPEKMHRTMRQFLLLFSGGSLFYLALLWVFRDQVFTLFYSGKYSQYSGWPLALAGLLPLGTCLTAVLGNALRALERPDLMFWCSGGSVIATVAIGIPMAARMGVGGALAGLHVSSLVSIVLMFVLYRKCLRSAAGEASLQKKDSPCAFPEGTLTEEM